MNNDNYQIENLEDEACKRSNTAKRVAAGLGLAALGGGAAFAANELMDSDTAADGSHSDVAQPGMTADEFTASLSGGVSEQDMPDPAPTPEPEPVVQEVHVHHHYEEPKVVEPEVEFDGSTVMHDTEGNVVAQIDEGTIDGTKFALYDVDGDGIADGLAYDVNQNGRFDDNEFADVSRENIAMSDQRDAVHMMIDDVAQVDNEDYPLIEVTPEEENIDDIRNDFTYEKTGETYGRDVAQNNPDYNGRTEVEQYAEYSDTYEDGRTSVAPRYEDLKEDDLYAQAEVEGYDSYESPMAENDLAVIEEEVYEEQDLPVNDMAYEEPAAVDDMAYDETIAESGDEAPADDFSEYA